MQLVRLKADKFVDLSRFVAIVPNPENHCYSLILEGSDRDVAIDRDDIDIIAKYLGIDPIAVQTKYNLADLVKPQAVAALQARIAKHEAMSNEESELRAATWERFKQTIDADRAEDSKLYS